MEARHEDGTHGITLTDPDAADPGSNAIRALIPRADGGPDGNQLDAYDQNGDPL